MKKFLIATSVLTLWVNSGYAQSIKDLKAQVVITKDYLKAKELVTTMETLPRNQKDAEFWYYKGVVYDSIAENAKLKGTDPNAKETAINSYKKAYETDPKLGDLVNTQFYPFFAAYLSYSNSATNLFNAKKYCEAGDMFKKVDELGSYIAKNKWVFKYKDTEQKDAEIKPLEFDKDNVYNTALCYEKCGKKDQSLAMYKILADKKEKSKDYETFVYPKVISYHLEKGEFDLASKYTNIASEVYPELTDIFFEPELQLHRKNKEYTRLFASYDKALEKAPKSTFLWGNYLIEITNYIYNGNEGGINGVEYNSRVTKAVAAHEKALSIDNSASYNAQTGNLYSSLGNDFLDKAREIKFPIDPKTKKAKQLSPEQAKAKNALKKSAEETFDKSLKYLLEAEKKYNEIGVSKLEKRDKRSLARTYELIGQIYGYKNVADKAKAYQGMADKLTKESL
jgi:hypothetical protein